MDKPTKEEAIRLANEWAFTKGWNLRQSAEAMGVPYGTLKVWMWRSGRRRRMNAQWVVEEDKR